MRMIAKALIYSGLLVAISLAIGFLLGQCYSFMAGAKLANAKNFVPDRPLTNGEKTDAILLANPVKDAEQAFRFGDYHHISYQNNWWYTPGIPNEYTEFNDKYYCLFLFSDYVKTEEDQRFNDAGSAYVTRYNQRMFELQKMIGYYNKSTDLNESSKP